MRPAGWARYRVLGPVGVESAAGPVALGGRRQRLLLAALLLEPRHVLSTDRLCEALWGDDQPSHPAAALRSQVARLRRTLSDLDTDVRADANGYRLDVDPEDVDVHRFHALIDASVHATGEAAVVLLDEALQLWRGPLPAELSDCPFMQPTVVRLDEMRVAGRERRADLLLALGRPDDTAAELRALIPASTRSLQIRKTR